MKTVFTFLAFLFIHNAIFASNIKASQIAGHPYVAANATDAFQTAGYFSVDTVIIDFVGNGEWIINTTTFFNLTNKTFLFEAGVKLIAANGFGLDDCLFKLRFCNTVKLIGTNTLFKMQKAAYTTGEFRHCFAILDCENIEATNFIMQDSGGDGVFIAAFAPPPAKQYCENITLKNIICDNNRRQGISLISVQNLLVEHCSFKNTKGTLPEAGLDIEPDLATERIVNVEFRKCSFTSNFGNGIQLAMLNLRNTSAPISVTFNDCYISQNSITTNTAPNSFYQKCEISAGASDANFVTGVVNFNRCLVENSQWSALTVRKAAESYGINFNDCVFRNVSQSNVNFNNPIWLELVSYDAGSNIPFGGVNFYNQLIDFNTNMAFMQVYGSGSNDANLGNVAGNITVRNSTINTNPIYVSTANEPTANYTYNFIPNYPITSLDVASTNPSISEIGCNKNIFTYTRTGANNTLPLPVSYTLSGSATNEKDYFHMPSFAILPALINTINDTLFAYDDAIIEADETINLSTNSASNFSIGTGTFSTLLKDGACPIVLPVRFIDIKVKRQNTAHLIQFNVANETNNTTYFIEKSLNGIDFFSIGKIEVSISNTGDARHSFLDKNPSSGINYYRVKQVENKKFFFSLIVSIHFKKDDMAMYPNPTNGSFKLQTSGILKSIQVFNTKAELVLSLDHKQNNFDVSTIASGVYFLRIVDENNNAKKLRFIKL
jgi:Secretion system C-terminal sorting domain